jgi:hypothetical protein
MLVRDNRTSSANGAFGRQDRQDSAAIRLLTAGRDDGLGREGQLY